jgi:glycosyltransferase involved in cell wall biosynthesis
MLSILIPTYNYNVFPLVLELHEQCDQCGIEYEIIVLDDAGKFFLDENKAINKLENCTFSTGIQNIGRSKMRNLLAQKAKHDWLLFLDADTIPLRNNFISTYIKYVSPHLQMVYGGITYSIELPSKDRMLRWFYGKKREAIVAEKRNLKPYISFLTLNFLIPKTFFKSVSFNENIPNLRHEDTLFSFELAKQNIPLLHITNPIVHLGLDTNEVFLNKTRESVVALKNLVDEHLIAVEYVRLSQMFSTLQKIKCSFIFAFMFEKCKSKIEKQLCSENPSMLLFDLYRLGYYCLLNKNKYV